MPLIIEDGLARDDAQSYVSVINCNAYHSARGNTAWSGTDEEKSSALLKAVQYIDGHYRTRWKGAKTSRTQALCWPRTGARDADGWVIGGDEIPQEVIDATCEAALRAMTGELSPDMERGGKVLSETVGPISVTYAPGASGQTQYSVIDNLLSGLLRSSISGQMVRG